MSYNGESDFTKDNLDMYLRELAKEFRRINGKTLSAEIILVGGAAILVNYGFRDATTDMDAVIHASSAMRDAIVRVGDRFRLPNGWLNTDFMRTMSFSPKLEEVSVYYRTFSNVLEIRTITAEYLIAMKLCSARKYRSDLSDVVGILTSHKRTGTPIVWEDIDKAVCFLYGDWSRISDEVRDFIEEVLEEENYEEIYESVRQAEKRSNELLKVFEKEYPKVLKESNINEILENLMKRQ